MPINSQNFKRFDKRVNALLDKMTLREKIGQLNHLGKQTGYRAGKPGQSRRTASGQWLLYSVVRFILGL